jgi:hypothetical protein
MKQWRCQQCSTIFSSYHRGGRRPRKYCSHECANMARTKQPKILRCLSCNEIIFRSPSNRTKQPYCSKACQLKHMKGESSPFWKGGETLKTQPNGTQYWMVQIGIGKPYAGHPNGKLVYKARYRLMIEQYLNRPLNRQEVVYHINNITTDDRFENLYVFPSIAAKNKAFFSYHGEGLPTKSNIKKLKESEDQKP